MIFVFPCREWAFCKIFRARRKNGTKSVDILQNPVFSRFTSFLRASGHFPRLVLEIAILATAPPEELSFLSRLKGWGNAQGFGGLGWAEGFIKIQEKMRGSMLGGSAEQRWAVGLLIRCSKSSREATQLTNKP